MTATPRRTRRIGRGAGTSFTAVSIGDFIPITGSRLIAAVVALTGCVLLG